MPSGGTLAVPLSVGCCVGSISGERILWNASTLSRSATSCVLHSLQLRTVRPRCTPGNLSCQAIEAKTLVGKW